ncbi:MAG: winged helix-turn-helix transcriptional regulator, partial [Pseudomonadota bacterium]
NQLIDGVIWYKVAASVGWAFAEFVLTVGGRELAPVMIALSQWGDKWVAHKDGPSTEIIDAESGERLPRIWPRREDGRKMQLSEVGMRRANGAPEKNWSRSKEDD